MPHIQASVKKRCNFAPNEKLKSLKSTIEQIVCMLKARIKSYAKSHKLRLAAIVYFSISALLSLTIFLRLLVLPIEPIKYANAILYYLNYYILPLSVGFAFIIMFSLHLPKVRIQKRPVKYAFVISMLSGLTVIVLSLLIIGVPEYFSLILPIPIATALYISQLKPKKSFSKRQISLFLTILISFSFIMPPVTTYFCYQNVLSQASTKTPTESASYISNLAINSNFNSPQFLLFITASLRLNANFQKYLMTGAGACQEMAMSTSTFLNNMGLNSHTAGFPGEDHEFTEVYLNGTWYVLDPGYYHGQILTREQRADKRLTEMGAISYVIANVNSSFVELTQYYVPTDTIIIRVVDGNEPVINAQIYLEHTFLGQTWRLPDSTHVFNSDSNGTVTLHMGNLDYNSNAGKVDSFYKI